MAISTATTAFFRPPYLIPVLLLIILLLGTTPLYGVLGQRRKTEQKHLIDCGDLVSRSQCSRNTHCRWCQSDALDDTCFSKSESSRLPSQIFSCQ